MYTIKRPHFRLEQYNSHMYEITGLLWTAPYGKIPSSAKSASLKRPS